MSDLGNREVFSANLRRYMEIKKVTRTDICNALGFKYSTFTDWVNGAKYPRIDKIEMLANYFGIEKSDLIERKSANSNPQHLSDDEVKFALFHGADVEVTDEMYDEVLRFRDYIIAKAKADQKKE